MKTHGRRRKYRRSKKRTGTVLAVLFAGTVALLCICVVIVYATGGFGKNADTESEVLTEAQTVSEESVDVKTADLEISGDPLPVKTAGTMTGLSGTSDKPGDTEKDPADADAAKGKTGADPQNAEPQEPEGVVTGTLTGLTEVQEGQPADPAAEQGEPAQEGGETPAQGEADGGAQTDAQTEPAAPAYTPEEEAAIAAYYSNTVLAGDSVMLGFRNYCRSGDPVMQGLNFLVAGSYSLHNAFWPVGGDSVHPLYQGQQRLLWESIQMIGPNRVFLFFGINDMVYGIDDTVAKYKEMIDMIKSVTPDVQIVIMSTTYTLAGQGKKNLNNTNIAKFNQTMAAEAASNGWGYIDIATPTSDGNGNLLPAYCSDGYLHQSRSAYVVWENTLKEYALRQSGLR